MSVKALKFLLLFLLPSSVLFGQETPDSLATIKTDEVSLNIREELDESQESLIAIQEFWRTQKSAKAIREGKEEVFQLALPLVVDSAAIGDTTLSIWELERWMESINSVKQLIKSYTVLIDNDVDTLRFYHDKLKGESEGWRLEEAAHSTDSALYFVWEEQISSIQAQLQKETKRVLDSINRLSESETELYELVQDLNETDNLLKTIHESDIYHVIRKDLPPLWSKEAREVSKYQLVGNWGMWWKEIRVYSKFSGHYFIRISLSILIATLILIFLKRYGRRHRWLNSAQRFKVLMAWLYLPLASAILITVFINRYIFMDGLDESVSKPGMLNKFESMMGYTAMMLIVWRNVASRLRGFLLFPLIFFVIDAFIISLLGVSFEGRVALLIETAAVFIGIGFIIRKLRRTHAVRTRKWYGPVIFLLVAIMGFEVVAAITIISGNFSLSRIMTFGSFYVLGMGIIIYFINLSIPRFFQALVSSPFGKRTHIVREFLGDNLRPITLLVQYYLLIIWLIGLANQLNFGQQILEFLKVIWNYRFDTGDISISVSSIVEFLIVLGIVYFVAQFLQVIVRDEVAGRLTKKKGLPMAYGVITKYVVFFVGFLAAASVLGIPLDRLSFVLGALGVGIGFGLQAVVGNFIAGIIILFERPMRVGDIIRIGTQEGEVKEIGARAVRIRLWEGAEVLVPNYDIMTKNVTNWTLNDSFRRIEAFFPVHPEAPIEDVLDIMRTTAQEIEGVVTEPAPVVQFKGVENSHASYRCLLWITEDILRIDSEFRTKVYEKLEEKGWNMKEVRVVLREKE
ncbi:mechanosensitive ion channel domain-containing protein [Phaeocystidibacter luteus]|uniref:Mechanosensitive ion channel n=1 Tax=Phaeocystidibacter luteus TaxID=911197 RepID=A0A6N6RCQ6_9FLAO|nr:mechanosensitive ion channel domain-containing protein [Phaeocystidibacter luteus]KAB2805349.1 mechanosensitive ion channel [Phaeocystidibacter luteus]